MGFFDTVKDKAGALAADTQRAGKVTAAQARLVVLQNDLKKAERELGHAAFALAERGELDHPDLAHAVERLRATMAEVRGKEAEIAALRGETAPAETPMTTAPATAPPATPMPAAAAPRRSPSVPVEAAAPTSGDGRDGRRTRHGRLLDGHGGRGGGGRGGGRRGVAGARAGDREAGAGGGQEGGQKPAAAKAASKPAAAKKAPATKTPVKARPKKSAAKAGATPKKSTRPRLTDRVPPARTAPPAPEALRRRPAAPT